MTAAYGLNFIASALTFAFQTIVNMENLDWIWLIYFMFAILVTMAILVSVYWSKRHETLIN